MNSICRLLCLIALIFVISCGGGGGGLGGGIGTLIYQTDWTGRANPGGGVSQRVSIIDADGRIVKSIVANQTKSAVEEYRLESIPAGNYLIKVELFSQTNLSGVKTGEFQTLLTIVAETLLRSQVGEPVTAVKVTPEDVTSQVPKSVAFYAMPQTAAGEATFAQPATYTWTALGGIGTVNSEGRLLTTTAGNGSVRAKHNPTGNLGSAIVHVNPPTITTGKWTIFVFLNAANDLFSFSPLNVNQMETAAGNPDVRFVLQWKQSVSKFSSSTFDGTRRVVVKPDNTGTVVSEVVQDMGSGVDMGRPETMKAFLDWAKTYYPAQHYGLVVWNHGNGWRRSPNNQTRAVSYDDETGNAIQIWELQTGLAGHHFDFIAWDASLMQMMEVAYEIRDRADYIVGSEESPPAEGYPYDTIFAQFRDHPDSPVKDLTKSFVDGMLGVTAYNSRKITQSVLDTSKLSNVTTAVDNLAGELMLNNVALHNQILTVRAQAQAYSQTANPPRYYRDLIDVCQRMDTLSSIPSVDTACQSVITAAQAAIVWEGHNANSAGSKGVAIDFTPGNVFLSSSTDYAKMRFGQATRWDDWLVVSP